MSRSMYTVFISSMLLVLAPYVEAVFIKNLPITDVRIEKRYEPCLRTTVAYLDLSRKGIHTLKDIESILVYYNDTLQALFEIPHLYINLNYNGLNDIDHIVNLDNLVGLSLVKTGITALPHNIGKLTNLKILDIAQNFLEGLPESFNKLIRLEQLDISINLFRNIPSVVGSCVSLNTLIAHQNLMSSLPDLSNLAALTHLNVSHNLLESSMLAFLADMNHLKYLDLSENKLTEIPESVTRVPQLRVLKLSSNSIKAIPDTIKIMENLELLDLQFCALDTISEEIGFLSNLKELHLFTLKDIKPLQKLLEFAGTFSALLKGSIFVSDTQVQNKFHDRMVVNRKGNRAIRLWPSSRLRIYSGKYNELHLSSCNIQSLKDIDLLYVLHDGVEKRITEVEDLVLDLSGNEIEQLSSVCSLHNLNS